MMPERRRGSNRKGGNWNSERVQSKKTMEHEVLFRAIQDSGVHSGLVIAASIRTHYRRPDVRSRPHGACQIQVAHSLPATGPSRLPLFTFFHTTSAFVSISVVVPPPPFNPQRNNFNMFTLLLTFFIISAAVLAVQRLFNQRRLPPGVRPLPGPWGMAFPSAHLGLHIGKLLTASRPSLHRPRPRCPGQGAVAKVSRMGQEVWAHLPNHDLRLGARLDLVGEGCPRSSLQAGSDLLGPAPDTGPA
jgi:hypothetical protein